MNEFLREMLQEALQGRTFTSDQMHRMVSAIMDGECDPLQTAGLLCVLSARGETADEFAGAARAMRERATLIRQQGTGLLDTCGTGGSGLRSFNISTAAALVCAAGGVPVAKHGNRSISSTSGSADVLEQLGVRIDLNPQQVDECIQRVGIGFCFAPLLHQAMKNVGPIRKALGVRTLFNMLGPLTNPARAEFQVLGTIRNHFAEKLAQALALLGTTRAVVLCGNNELDEISLWGKSQLFLVERGTVSVREWSPADVGLAEISPQEIQVESAAESARRIEAIFAGDPSPSASMVAINAAAGLWITGRAPSLNEAYPMAEELLRNGAAQRKLQELVACSQSLAEN